MEVKVLVILKFLAIGLLQVAATNRCLTSWVAAKFTISEITEVLYSQMYDCCILDTEICQHSSF